MDSTGPALHERLRFDTARGQVLDADRRYVLMRADVLMGAFDALPGAAREDALRALARSVTTHGGGSVRAYAASAGAAALAASIEAAAASLGWGVWRLRQVPASTGTPAEVRLEVDNSPFAAASARHDAPACAAIAGMLEAVAGALWHVPAAARETHCAACAGGTTCRFVAVARDATIDGRGPDSLFRPHLAGAPASPPGDP